jgi:hypothetical protein
VETLVKAFEGLPRQQLRAVPKVAAWLENGEYVGNDRGSPIPGRATAVDDPLIRTRNLLRGRLAQLFPYTRAVCYSFQADEPAASGHAQPADAMK